MFLTSPEYRKNMPHNSKEILIIKEIPYIIGPIATATGPWREKGNPGCTRARFRLTLLVWKRPYAGALGQTRTRDHGSSSKLGSYDTLIEASLSARAHWRKTPLMTATYPRRSLSTLCLPNIKHKERSRRASRSWYVTAATILGQYISMATPILKIRIYRNCRG